MPYRVNKNGTIETDTPEAALELAALFDRKKHGTRPNHDTLASRERTRDRMVAATFGVTEAPASGKKSSTRRRSAPKTRAAAKNGRRPQLAVQYGIRIGQVWCKRSGGKSAGREIQVAQLLKEGIVPKILKDAPDLKGKGSVKKISYKQLHNVYKLIKDV